MRIILLIIPLSNKIYEIVIIADKIFPGIPNKQPTHKWTHVLFGLPRLPDYRGFRL